MRLSTKSRYGLRAMIDIAQNCTGTPAQIQDISTRQHISPRYLEQIFQNLKRAGLLRSKRGPQGGYCLSRKPEEISVLEILNATEQDILLVECSGKPGKARKRRPACPDAGKCLTQMVWEDANKILSDFFGTLTLAALCQRGMDIGIMEKPEP